MHSTYTAKRFKGTDCVHEQLKQQLAVRGECSEEASVYMA